MDGARGKEGRGVLLGAQPEAELEFILEFGLRKGEVTRRRRRRFEGVARVKWIRTGYLDRIRRWNLSRPT